MKLYKRSFVCEVPIFHFPFRFVRTSNTVVKNKCLLLSIRNVFQRTMNEDLGYAPSDSACAAVTGGA